jgi:hypothetical protein
MFDQQPVKDELVVQEIKNVAVDTAGWLKFIGVFFIIYGGLIAITIIGIVIAWLPIWMGILLYSAGKKASDAQYTNNPMYLVEMMRKFKTFFIIQGVLLILGLIGILLAIALVGVGIFTAFKGFDSF